MERRQSRTHHPSRAKAIPMALSNPTTTSDDEPDREWAAPSPSPVGGINPINQTHRSSSAQRMDGGQSEQGGRHGQGGQCQETQDDAEDQSDHPVSAMSRVLEDPEGLFRSSAGTERVDSVGQPVLMQSPGDDDPKRHGQRGRGQIRQHLHE